MLIVYVLLKQDKRIEELRRLLRRYKKIEELVAQAQGRKGNYCSVYIWCLVINGLIVSCISKNLTAFEQLSKRRGGHNFYQSASVTDDLTLHNS